MIVLLDDTAEFNQVNTALLSIFKMDAKGKFSFIFIYFVVVLLLLN